MSHSENLLGGIPVSRGPLPGWKDGRQVVEEKKWLLVPGAYRMLSVVDDTRQIRMPTLKA